MAIGTVVWAGGGAALAIFTGLFGVNYIRLQVPMDNVVARDGRNNGVDVDVHYGAYVKPSVLMYDIQDVSGDKSPVDVFRVFLQFADSVQEQRFERVELAFRGDTKFLLSGRDFATLGQEYEDQNPIYIIRTFPEKLTRPDGTKAFETWTGGVLGVAGEQMQDFTTFHRQWYIDGR